MSETFDPAAGPARGILRRSFPPGLYAHTRRVPAPALTPVIVHYWMVEWNLPPGAREIVATVPHPNVQLVFSSGDPASILVHGVHTGKFTQILQGRARVFGVKFRAGGFRAFLDHPVAAFRDRIINATALFGESLERLAAVLTGDERESVKVASANLFFKERLKERDPQWQQDAALAARLVDLIARDLDVRSVAGLEKRSGLGQRHLQRLFHNYVGVSPKWVIRRYRLHELVERLNSGSDVNWAETAQELGYFDQSHLIRDFRRVTGQTPERYRLK